MIRLVLLATLLVGCRMSLEDDEEGDFGDRRCSAMSTSTSCAEAANHSDLTWIEANIFKTSCTFSGCHNGAATPAGELDLREGMSRASLVDVASRLEPTRKLVVPMDIEASYLMLMLGDFPPPMASPPAETPSVGYMPQGVSTGLCCTKLDALERWIMAGAPNN